MSKYKNKYRNESWRKPGWNYAASGRYYITLVIQHRACILGEIVNNKMILSDFGKIIEREWNLSFEIRDELTCVEFVIMPNHIHAVIHLIPPSIPAIYAPGEKYGVAKRMKKSISSFLAGFKSRTITLVDDRIDELQLDIPKYNRKNKLWQPNYHDHVIRNDKSYHNIKKYIRNNPKNWDGDRFAP